MRRRRATGLKIGSLAAFLTIGVALSACTPPPEPSPTISWSPSAPAGDYEGTDWIKAIRAYHVALAEALNAHDFTSPELIALVGAPEASRLAGSLRGRAKNGEYPFFAGPKPFVVLELTENAGTATVRICEPQDWAVTAEDPSPTLSAEGHESTYHLKRDDEGVVTIGISGVSERPCDLTGVSVGLFDPQPDVTKTYSPDDVKGP